MARRNKFKKYEACDKVQRGCSSYKAAGPKSCLIQGISGDKNNQLRSPTGLPDVLQILVLVYNLSKKTSITEPRLQLLKFTLCVNTLVTPNLVYLLWATKKGRQQGNIVFHKSPCNFLTIHLILKI